MSNILCLTIGHKYLEQRYDYVFVCSRCGRVLVWADSERWNGVGPDGKAVLFEAASQTFSDVLASAATHEVHSDRVLVADVCACGCGQTPKSGKKYLKGHNMHAYFGKRRSPKETAARKTALDAFDTAMEAASDAYNATIRTAKDAAARKAAVEAYEAAMKSAGDAYHAAIQRASQ